MPAEVRRLLEGRESFRGFVGTCAYAEPTTPLDDFGGNTRNHDLIVFGAVGGAAAMIDVEGKADEPFGRTIGERLSEAERELARNPRSQALTRVRQLCHAIFSTDPDVVGHLRYQLLHGTAAALIRARQGAASRVAFVIHEFLSDGVRSPLVARNASDLAAFVRCLGGTVGDGAQEQLAGPFYAPGNDRVPADVGVFIGKTAVRLENGPAVGTTV